MKKVKLLFAFVILIESFAFTQPCLPEGISIHTQEEIDNFQINYPNCTEIEGFVSIGGEGITNLNGLSMLNSIGGHLIISVTSLLNMTGLENLNYVGGDLRFGSNDSLTSFTGLGNLTSINGSLRITKSHGLLNLSGLENLTSINGRINIDMNYGLINLSGLDNINAGSITDLRIVNNTSLTNCEVQSICDYLISPNGVVEIYRNAQGCDSPPDIANACGIALPCLPFGNYHFRNQAVIDNFQSDYPNCTELAGDVIIAGINSITNVDGLNIVTSIEGGLRIWYNGPLTSLEGLQNLSFIGGRLLIDANFNLPSLTGLESLTSIGGYLQLDHNNNLVNLTGLDNISSLGGSLRIISNSDLTNLTGLNKLISIGGDLDIFSNHALVDITGLDSLMSITGRLFIHSNITLPSLIGLDNINAGSITDLTISENSNLVTCEIQSVCDYLASPNGVVDIYENAYGCNSITEISDNCGISLSCLPYGNYYFFSQADIDDFQINFPGCSELEGTVTISGTDITNLNGLNTLTSIGENLYIWENSQLISLIGLNSVTSIGQALAIQNNEYLPNLSGLDNLSSINGWLSIGGNPVLISLMGLNSLISGVGPLGIRDNDALTSLTGIDNIELGSSVNSIEIYGNDSLSTCEVHSVCDYLLAPYGYGNIYDNAPGCNSQSEVEEACETIGIRDRIPDYKFSIYPNPATDKLHITNTNGLKIETVTIYNQLGQMVLHKNEIKESINISTLGHGMYIIELTSNELKIRRKLIIEE